MVLTANLSALVPNLVETDALTNVFTITLTDGDLGLPAQVITVNYVVSGTALAGTDYTALTGSVNINIPANTATGSATIQIDPLDDLQLEGTETLTLTLAEDPGTNTQPYVLGTTQTSSTIAIVDDLNLSGSETALLPQISVVASDPVAEETDIVPNNGTASFTFTRSNDPNLATSSLRVYFTVGGTATPDPEPPNSGPDDSGDFVISTLGTRFNATDDTIRFITFAAGETTATVSFDAIDDALFDPDESVTITILPSNFVDPDPADQYTIGVASATATIVDNDVLVLPTVSINANPTSVNENNPNILDRPVFTISRSGGSSLNDPLTVVYTISGSAQAGTDYTALTGSVTIAAGQASATIEIAPLDDFQVEGSETVTLTLADPVTSAEYILGTDASATIQITDNETSLIPSVSVAASDPTALENSDPNAPNTATFTFTRSNTDLNLPLIVYFTVGGTATPDPDPSGQTSPPDDAGDFVISTLGDGFNLPDDTVRSITFESGEDTKTISFAAIDDALFDPDESVTITILPSNIVNEDPAVQYTIGVASDTATIVDNEVQPLVSISPAFGTVDEGGSQTFVVSLDNGPAAQNLYIQLNVGGTATNPNLLEDINGGFDSDPLNPSGPDAGDDFFVPNFLLNVPDPNNPGSTVLATTPTVFIAAGSTTATFTVRTVSDANPLNDDNETVTIAVLDGGTDYAVGATGSATLNIRDLDNQGQISITPGTSLAIEGGTTATFTLTRTGYNLDQVVVPFTLAGTATSLTDYTLVVTSGNATIDLANQTITLNAVAGAPADGTTQTVTIELTAIADGVVDSVTGDGTETVTLTLTPSPIGLYNLGTSNSTGQIRIDDVDVLQLPTVTIAAGPATVAEEETDTGNYGVFTLTRTGGNSLQFPLTVAYTITGSATNGADFSTLTGTVTFAANSNTAEVVIAPLDDATFEGTESVTLTLAEPVAEPPQYVLGAADSATIAITENETANTGIPQITVLATDPTAEEVNSIDPGGEFVINPGVFTVTLNGAPITSALTVNYTIGGTATAGVDYQALTGSIVFDVGGATSKTIDVRAIDDLIAEPGETVTITLSSSPNYTIGQDAFAEVTVIDNDDRGPFTVATTQALGIEGGQDARFTIDRTTDLGATTVNFTLDGTATAGSDYTVITLDGAGNEVVLTPGLNGSYNVTFTSATGTGTDLQRVILVRPVDDAEFEGLVNETVTLTLQTPADSSYTLGTPIEGNASIQDNDAEVSISSTDTVITEGGSPGSFTISRTSSDLTGALTVNYSISGTAANGLDYTLLSGTATIAAGQPSIDVPVTVINDALVENTETLTLNLNAGTGYSVGATNSITYSILDNEPFVSVIATTDTVVEGAGNGVFTITRTGGDTSQDLVVNYTITGTAIGSTDYALLPGTATILAGQTSVTVNVATFDDPVFEGSESVTLTIGNDNTYRTLNGFESDTVTITDNNDLLLETVSISAAPGSVAENETVPANRSIFTITRDAANGFANDLTVFYTISGSATVGADYDTITGSVTIAAGQASATVEIAPLDDLDFEGTESVTLTLTDPVQGPPQYILGTDFTAGIAITDNETLPGASPEIEVTVNDPSADENDATDRAIFTFTRTVATDTELTVNYAIGGNATNGTDYQPITGTITFAVGEASRDLVITAIDDVALEGPETVTVSITPDAGGAYTIGTARVATVFIIDNENNAPTLNAAILDDFVLNEDAGAVVLRNGNNRTFAQLVQDAFADEDINVPENENETLKAIRFVTLTASGNLTLNGVLVTENQVVEFATNAEVSEFLDSLRYEPDPDFFGQSEDLQSRPDRFTIVASDGVSDSRETDVVINVRPVNDAPFYVLPGEDSFNGGSAAQHNDFYQDSSIIGNLAFSGGNTRNFALRPGVRVSIRDFVQGGANEPNPVVGPENERVNRANSVLPAGNQTLTFSTDLVGDDDIFDEAPTIAADGTLTFKLKDAFPGGFGTAQVRLSVQDTGGTANNGIDTLVKGFFIVTGDENALSNVIQTFETPVGGTGSLIYNTTVFPVGEDIGVNLHQGVLQLGTSASLDNIVGLYEIVDPDGGIDQGKDLDGDGKITTLEELQAKDGIADIYPTAENRVAYAEAALENRVTSWNLRAGSNGDPLRNFSTTTFNAQRTGIEGGSLYAPFIIANGGEAIVRGNAQTVNQAINFFLSFGNPNNNPASSITDPVAYFGFSEVNPDGAEHLRYLRNETAIVNGRTQTIGIYGFEDMPGGGDRDFNDAIFGFQFVAS